MTEVIIRKCPSYDSNLLKASASEIFKHFGGVNALYKKGGRVAVKVNLITPAKPEEAITTHPAVVWAFCEELLSAGVTPVIMDSPNAAIKYSPESLKKIYEQSGYFEHLKGLPVEFNYDVSSVTARIQNGKAVKLAELISPVLNADGVLNLAKGKTHAFTCITGATKNLFGTVAGISKGAYHAKLKNVENFSDMLLDIAGFVKPALSVIDAVVCMEGNGPTGGTPKPAGYLIASTNTCAADKVFCDLIGFPFMSYPLLKKASERGILEADSIKLTGSYEIVKDFKMPDTSASIYGFVNPNAVTRLFALMAKDLLTLKPDMNSNCTGCAVCAKGCPMKAISIKKKRAVIDHSKCIRCYCCHEMCPNKAVDLKKKVLYRLGEKLLGRK